MFAYLIAFLFLASAGSGAAPDTTSLGVDLNSLSNLKGWLAVWSPDEAPLTASSFRFQNSWEIKETDLWMIADSGATYSSFPPAEARRWVFSPDSSNAVKFLPDVDEEGYPMFEPDSDVQLLESDRGRWQVILMCGTPCDFEVADWIDAKTALIGAGNWDQLRAVLYRVNIPKRTVDMFYGPQLPIARRKEIQSAVRKLWSDTYPWIHWDSGSP